MTDIRSTFYSATGLVNTQEWDAAGPEDTITVHEGKRRDTYQKKFWSVAY
jgi:hypothetical protein